jgi:hypothetical protein
MAVLKHSGTGHTSDMEALRQLINISLIMGVEAVCRHPYNGVYCI